MQETTANQVAATATSSFTEHLQRERPGLLPFGLHSAGHLPAAAPNGAAPLQAPHGTTIVALSYAGGVLMAGDRRATMGNVIASRHIEKVFPADQYSVLGIAGTAGIALDLTRLFQVELEHYEKIEGTLLSLEGKANRLGAMIRGNLPMAMQGLAVVPLFAGFDRPAGIGRLFSYDVTRRTLRGAGAPHRRVRLHVRPRRAEEAVAAQPHGGGSRRRRRRSPL
ncbi:hypothetical protein QFZ79_003425 [Arthrobacter sp. V4I6]|nr:hypothetical protein [Arthrobacter sp. V4I6]